MQKDLLPTKMTLPENARKNEPDFLCGAKQ
jgi:hypothetical protein